MPRRWSASRRPAESTRPFALARPPAWRWSCSKNHACVSRSLAALTEHLVHLARGPRRFRGQPLEGWNPLVPLDQRRDLTEAADGAAEELPDRIDDLSIVGIEEV